MPDTNTAHAVVTFCDGCRTLEVLSDGRRTFSIALTDAVRRTKHEKSVSAALRACLDHLAQRGYWPIGGRELAIAHGPIPLVCLPIERVRATAEARIAARQKEPDGWDAETAILRETEDAQRCHDIETLRALAAKYPDALNGV